MKLTHVRVGQVVMVTQPGPGFLGKRDWLAQIAIVTRVASVTMSEPIRVLASLTDGISQINWFNPSELELLAEVL